MKFLRIGQVLQLTGLSRMTIYRLELAGEFPRRRRLSKNSVAWLDSDIAQWAESRPVSQLRGTRDAPARGRSNRTRSHQAGGRSSPDPSGNRPPVSAG